MGYILVFLLILAVAALFLPLLASRRAPKPHGGSLPSDHPVSREEPASDEAKPSKSITASPRQQENAERRTPPA
jgi:Na+-transporting methylmalonyl-CoA/oxaloacetate decarboxylase gamma subunit